MGSICIGTACDATDHGGGRCEPPGRRRARGISTEGDSQSGGGREDPGGEVAESREGEDQGSHTTIRAAGATDESGEHG